MARRLRPRKEFKFWLYEDQIEDNRLIEYVAYLRKTHLFTTAVRNGLRLMWTLAEGDFSVLFELFPMLRPQFIPKPEELIEQFRNMLQATSTVKAEPPDGLHQLELPLDPMPAVALPAPILHNEGMERAIQEAVQAGIQQALNQLTGMQPVSSPPPTTSQKSNLATAAKIATRELPMPIFDDDDQDKIVIRRDTSAGDQSAANFLDSVLGLQQG